MHIHINGVKYMKIETIATIHLRNKSKGYKLRTKNKSFNVFLSFRA